MRPGLRKSLIINADDMGLARAVNSGIIELHEKGLVTSTSILAVGTAFDDAVKQLLAHPDLDLGVHLALDEERPVLEARQVPSLTRPDGRFLSRKAVLVRLLSGRISLTEVEREWTAQLEKCRNAGLRITHLDGHGHLHMFPSVATVAARLARSSGISAVRVPSESATLLSTARSARSAAKATLISRVSSLSSFSDSDSRARDSPSQSYPQ